MPISSSLCVLKRCKLLLFVLRFFKAVAHFHFIIIILSYFRARYSKTTKFLHLVHNEVLCRQDSSVLAAVCTAGASTVCKAIVFGDRGIVCVIYRWSRSPIKQLVTRASWHQINLLHATSEQGRWGRKIVMLS